MTIPERVSTQLRQQEGRWRSVIRIFAVTIAFLGMVLVAHEIFENVTCDGQAFCVKIHLGTMLWGLAFLSLGLLILQKGDVSTSIKELTESGSVVRGWWGRRSYDKGGPVVVAPVALPATPGRAPELKPPPVTTPEGSG